VASALLGYLSWSLLGTAFLLTDRGTPSADFWDFQLLAYFGYANLTTLFMYGLVAGTKSKYATIAATRLLLVGTFLEVFFMACFLLTYAHSGGYGFGELGDASRYAGGHALALPPLGLFFLLYALFEAKRAPFDHSEAESELVAGHMVEYGGRALLFFYLCEYAHMVFCLFLLLTLVMGGAPYLSWAAAWPY
jgi:NADH-quinone oxidoreductase subunit H